MPAIVVFIIGVLSGGLIGMAMMSFCHCKKCDDPAFQKEIHDEWECRCGKCDCEQSQFTEEDF